MPLDYRDRNRKTDRNVSFYTDRILGSLALSSISSLLGGPVTQPSTMSRLRNEATVYCTDDSFFTTTNSFITCNVSQCLFDILMDPCERRNLAIQYPAVKKPYSNIVSLSDINYHVFSLCDDRIATLVLLIISIVESHYVLTAEIFEKLFAMRVQS